MDTDGRRQLQLILGGDDGAACSGSLGPGDDRLPPSHPPSGYQPYPNGCGYWMGGELRKLTGELTELKRKWKTLNDQVNDLTQEKENKINEVQSDEKSLADLNDEFDPSLMS